MLCACAIGSVFGKVSVSTAHWMPFAESFVSYYLSDVWPLSECSSQLLLKLLHKRNYFFFVCISQNRFMTKTSPTEIRLFFAFGLAAQMPQTKWICKSFERIANGKTRRSCNNLLPTIGYFWWYICLLALIQWWHRHRFHFHNDFGLLLKPFFIPPVIAAVAAAAFSFFSSFSCVCRESQTDGYMPKCRKGRSTSTCMQCFFFCVRSLIFSSRFFHAAAKHCKNDE